MTFLEIIKKLYSNEISQVVEVLNKSIHVSDGLYKSSDFCVHTGFTFVNQKGNKFELIYNGETEQIYRQPRISNNILPLIIGLSVGKGDSIYFNGHYGQSVLILHELENGTESGVLYSIKNIEKYQYENPVNEIEVAKDGQDDFEFISKFKIIDKEDKLLFEFPLCMEFKQKIFYNGNNNSFKKNISDLEYRDFEEDRFRNSSLESPNSTFYDATDGQLGELGEEGWTIIGRD